MPDVPSRLTAALQGRYRIERELGEGGMTTVYLPEDVRHEREVAPKVPRPELAAVRFLMPHRRDGTRVAHQHRCRSLPQVDTGREEALLRARRNYMIAAEIGTILAVLEAAGTVMTSQRVMAFDILDELKDRGKEAKR